MKVRSAAATLRFTELLLTLLRGKTGLLDALYILAQTNYAGCKGIERCVKDTAIALRMTMKKGKGLSDSLRYLHKGKVFFEPLYLTLITAAELTGNIEESLEYISADLKRRQWAKENAVNILIYPALIVVLAVAGTLAIIVIGMPFLVSEGLLSAVVVNDAKSGIYFSGSILLSGSASLFIFYFRIFNNDSPESRIFYLLDLQMRSSVRLLDALSQCVKSLGRTRYGNALVKIKRDITFGVSLPEAFAKSHCFSGYVLEWLTVADINGNLNEICGCIKDHYAQRDQKKREIAARLMEPAVIVLTGIYVLIIMITVILPILSYTGGIL